jgi:hypothetical protein
MRAASGAGAAEEGRRLSRRARTREDGRRRRGQMDLDRVQAEIDVLRGFIDFISRQVGVYCDCLGGFQNNKVRIERQIPRAQRPTSRRIEDGQPVIVWASVEDLSRPDVLHHRIIRASDFVADNSEAGFNEQQICWAIIVFVFHFWDEEIRPKIALVRQAEPNSIQLDALGDLRILRNSIIHNGGTISASDHQRLKVMMDICAPDAKLILNHDQMHGLFVFLKQATASLILQHAKHLPGAPDVSEITDIAIQQA